MQYNAIQNKYKTNTKQIQNKNKYNTNTIQLQYNSTQFNRVQCDTILYIYYHIYYHILCMYIFTYIQYPIQKLSLLQLIGWQLRLKRNSGPSGAEWDWQGRSWTVDLDLLLCGDKQKNLGYKWAFYRWILTCYYVEITNNVWDFPVDTMGISWGTPKKMIFECFWRLGYVKILPPNKALQGNIMGIWWVTSRCRIARSEKSIKAPVNSRGRWPA